MIRIVVLLLYTSCVESVCVEQPELLSLHKYLDGKFYSILLKTTVFECAASCASNQDCLSFSFNTENLSCHMHVDNTTTAPRNLTDREDWLHSDIAAWPKNILGACGNLSCKSGEHCSVNPRTQTPTCAPTAVQAPPIICSDSPIVPNAREVSGNSNGGSEGDVRSYSCNDGYLDVSVENVTANITCLKNGSWSELQLHCTVAVYGPPIICSDFPIVPNAREVSENSNGGSEGDVRSYRCNDGYLDISVENITANITCLKNGSWSELQLHCTGPYVSVHTKNEPYKQLANEMFKQITKASTIIFQGKTCWDMILKLHAFPTSGYEVVIGGGRNTWSGIRTCPRCILREKRSEKNVVSCNEFRPFWVSWKDGVIQVGKGNVVGEQLYIKWVCPKPITINSISLSSYYNNKGEWLFLKQNNI